MPSATWMHHDASRRRHTPNLLGSANCNLAVLSVTCNRNALSNKQPRSVENNCSNLFNRPCVNLLCDDASYVGADEGLCVGIDVLSIPLVSTVVRTLVNLAMMAQCSEIKKNSVSNVPAESPPTFGQ